MTAFSVVTLNLNMAHLLPETIESVLANLRPGDQYFVIDGGSTDDSAEVIQRYEDRLTGWISEPDSGYADALAKGFRRCTGEFLCWISSGDLLLCGVLASARKALNDIGADLIFGDDVDSLKRSVPVQIFQSRCAAHSPSHGLFCATSYLKGV